MSVAEGGGSHPPYRESFLERLVAVNWAGGGGVFVSGDFCCFQRYARMETKDSKQEWIGLGELDFGVSGTTHCSSYAKINGVPVMLLGGNGDDGLIMMSNDGLKWSTVLGGLDDTVINLVWDTQEKAFYAESGSLLRSLDGVNWGPASGDFESHCRGPLSGIGDGIYGYDKSKKIIIQGGGASPGNVLVTTENDAVEVATGLGYVNAVAYVGGIWVAGGSNALSGDTAGTASSIDDGKTWIVVSTGAIGMVADYNILTVIGAPIQDFR